MEMAFQRSEWHVLVYQKSLIPISAISNKANKVWVMKKTQHQNLNKELPVSLQSIPVELLDSHNLNTETVTSMSETRLLIFLDNSNHVFYCVLRTTSRKKVISYNLCQLNNFYQQRNGSRNHLTGALKPPFINSAEASFTEQTFRPKIIRCFSQFSKKECLGSNMGFPHLGRLILPVLMGGLWSKSICIITPQQKMNSKQAGSKASQESEQPKFSQPKEKKQQYQIC